MFITRRRPRGGGYWGAALLLPWTLALANPYPPDALQAIARDWLESEAWALDPQARITVNPPAATTPLPACPAPQPFLPPGKRPWGKVLVGVRCTEPTPWTVYLAARVTVPGTYVVTRHPLRAAVPVTADDLELRAGDLAALPDDIHTEVAAIVGQVPRRALAAHQPVRARHLQRPPLIQSGQTVTLVLDGAGFTVHGAGVALNAAAAGETVRVRLENGKTVHALTTPDGRATLRF